MNGDKIQKRYCYHQNFLYDNRYIPRCKGKRKCPFLHLGRYIYSMKSPVMDSDANSLCITNISSGGSRISPAGAPNPRVGRQLIIWPIFFPKSAWKWKKLDQTERGHSSLVPVPPWDPSIISNVDLFVPRLAIPLINFTIFGFCHNS